eukprot:2329270-Alexandrium_andersonii.AAC.1
MKAENIAYHELVRAIQSVVHRKHVQFQGAWLVPVSESTWMQAVPVSESAVFLLMHVPAGFHVI